MADANISSNPNLRRSLTGSILPWVVILEGAIALFIGLALMGLGRLPALASIELVRVLGPYWLAIGILWIIGSFENNAGRSENLAGGILGIIIGLASAYYIPLGAAALYIGIIGIIIGLIGLYSAYRSQNWGHGVIGLVSMLFGLIVSANSELSFWAGAIGIVGGIITIYAGFAMLSALRSTYPRTVPASRRVEPQLGAGIDPVEGGGLPDDPSEDETGK
ncbi:MAG TPA: hypothetical protein VN455_04155 [Methanotrichaceae archaeon]|nr:hypothetical protein [Methanotrichaceae archaeon]